MPLTDAACRGAKTGPVRRKLSDGGGLQLWVQTSGSRLWQLAYRYSGQQRQIPLGAYPQVSLAEARIKREDAKRLLREGRDPGAVCRPPPPGDTFREVAEEFLMKRRSESLAQATLDKKEWLLDFSYSVLGDVRLRDIRPIDVLGVLQEIERKGHYETARRLRSTIGAVFRYGIATARAEIDPTVPLRGAIIAPKVKSRAAIIDPERFGELLRAVESFEGNPTTVYGLRLLALLFPRPGELRSAEWSEFDFEKAVWTIPAGKTKMRREHRVPLPAQALALLEPLRKLTGHGKLLLPSSNCGRKPISENTINLALRRMGFGQDEMTSHGFRTTASTLLNESGKWSPDAIERQLAHIDRDGVRRAYARGAYWEERVKMMAWWAKYLVEMRSTKMQQVSIANAD